MEDLNLVKVLTKTPDIARTKSAYEFLGIISSTDIDLMNQAIEEGFEKIDADGWKWSPVRYKYHLCPFKGR